MHPPCGDERFAGASGDGWIEAQSITSRKYAGRIAASLSRTPLHGSGSGRSSAGDATRFGLNSVMPTASPLPSGGAGLGVADGVAVATGGWTGALSRPESITTTAKTTHAATTEHATASLAITPTEATREPKGMTAQLYGGATPQPQRGTGACSATSAPGWELCTARRVPHSA